MLARSLAFFALAFLLAAGCGPGKLNENRTLELNTEFVAKAIDLPAVSKAQKVNVEFTSSEGEVTVLVFKEDDAKGDDMAIAEDKKALGKKRGKSDNFTADVPENTKTRVVVRGATAAKTNVTVKITNAP